MAKKIVQTNHNPKLIQKELKGGFIALYLEYYIGAERTPRLDLDGNQIYHIVKGENGCPKQVKAYRIKHHRKIEKIGLKLFAKPKSRDEREHNAQTLLLAEKIRYEREAQFNENRYGYAVKVNSKTDFITLYREYYAGYNKKDRNNVAQSLHRFEAFLQEKYPHLVVKTSNNEIGGECRYALQPNNITAEMVSRFVYYLQEHSRGEGAHSTFARFKKAVKAIAKMGYIRNNPTEGIICKVDKEQVYELKKDVLTYEEVQKLVSTHYVGENPEIQKAFIFSLYTGIRWCDVREVRYKDIDYNNGTITFFQNKTGNRVTIPLTDDILGMIQKPEDKDRSDTIFSLPSHTMCLKALSHWVKRAGIEKHITWHCARHTFATLTIDGGSNVKVVAELLGHSRLKYIERYIRALDKAKTDAVNSLPKLNIL